MRRSSSKPKVSRRTSGKTFQWSSGGDWHRTRCSPSAPGHYDFRSKTIPTGAFCRACGSRERRSMISWGIGDHLLRPSSFSQTRPSATSSRADTLNVDQRLKITSLTFLFTDLKGSTELYERVGDLAAF